MQWVARACRAVMPWPVADDVSKNATLRDGAAKLGERHAVRVTRSLIDCDSPIAVAIPIPGPQPAAGCGKPRVCLQAVDRVHPRWWEDDGNVGPIVSDRGTFG